jgi:hypothetical protein
MQFSSVLQLSSRGAVNVSSTKDEFSVILQPPLHLPRKAYNVYLRVNQASIWNTTPNVVAGVNNLLYVSPTGGSPAAYITLAIPTGLYGTSELNVAILRALENAGYANLFTISADYPTQKIVINFTAAGTLIDFTQAQTLRDILGFNSRIVTGTPLNQLGDKEANFNTVNSFIIRTDLVDTGISVNGRGSQACAIVPITALPGSLINFQPMNPPNIPCERLAYGPQQMVTVSVTDEIGQKVIMIDDWSVVVEIVYSIPFESQSDPQSTGRVWY